MNRRRIRILLIVGQMFVLFPMFASEKITSLPGHAHWAFQPIELSQAPSIQGAEGSVIDLFIEAQLRARKLQPNPSADKYTLIRRATFDLTGLPPTPEEIKTFVDDPSTQAYQRLIDRLLASPTYGERWGRVWLDLARYADTNGSDENMAYPNAWRYRDYVIRSFNQDKPYDQFLREQLAGDLLPAAGDRDRAQDQIIATAFLALGPKMLAEQDKEKLLFDVVDEQVDVVTKTFLGLTVSCARCHDHKFDPVTQEDYFALAGIFRSTKTMGNTNHVSRWVETVLDRPENEAIVAAHREQVGGLKKEIEALEQNKTAENRDEQLKKWREQLQKLETAGPDLPRTMAVQEGAAVDLGVHVRGDHLHAKENKMARGVNELFARCLPSPAVANKASGRLELAQWLTDPKHPLTARVMVNRVWQGHFGSGLVRSPSNFGLRGQPPTHPDLLDWLAREFIEHGWSIKQLHRTIMLSQAYCRGSQAADANVAADPENIFLWRQNRRRLEAEQTRDALLFVSGQLDQAANNSLGELERNTEYYRADPASFQKWTRAIYLPVVRANGYEMFSTFDGPDAAVHHEQRAATVVPGQALFMLNSEMINAAAERLARACANLEKADRQTQMNQLFLRVLGRPPRAAEIELLSGTSQDWARVCRVLLAANEFVYIN